MCFKNILLCLIIILILLNLQCYGFDIPKLNTNDTINMCVNSVISFIETRNNIYSMDPNINIQMPTILYDVNKDLRQFLFTKMDVVILSGGINHLENIFNKIIHKTYFNPRAYFLIIITDLYTEIFNIISKYFIQYVIFIYANNTTLNLYTYQPFKLENIHEKRHTFTYVGECLTITKETFNAIPRNSPTVWRNSTIRLVCFHMPPYTNCPKLEGKHSASHSSPAFNYPGIEVIILDIIKQKLKFDIVVTDSSLTLWGFKENGTYTLMMGELFNRSSDMGIGAFHSRVAENLDFDLSVPYLEDSTTWVVPKASLLPEWKKLGLVMNADMYFSIIVIILVVALVCLLLYKENFLVTVYNLYQILFEVSLASVPSYKLILLCCILGFMVISTMFKSVLISVLLSVKYEHQIQNTEEMVKSGLELRFDKVIKKYYESDNPVDKYIFKNFIFCPDPRVCINRTAFVRDTATIDFKRVYMYNLPKYYVDSEGNPMIYIFKESVFPVHIHIFFNKGFPMLHQVNKILMNLESNGIIRHLYDEVEREATQALSRKTNLFTNVLNLKQMAVAFFVLILGCLISLVVFIVEFVINL